MKRFLVSLVFLFLPATMFAQQTYVPDDNFEQALIDLGYDTGELNDSVPTANIDIVLSLRIDMQNISDLTGIEDFTALVALICADNELTSLDLSKNYVLQSLHCWQNQLTSLDLSNNTALKGLFCDDNELTSLDISNNTALKGLSCDDNDLTSLDLSNNIALEGLSCSYNNLTSLDLSNNYVLQTLNCYWNNLTNLDLSNNPTLEKLHCFTNDLTSLDLSNNSNLVELYCNVNNLTSLNIKNGNNKNISDIRPGIYFNATDNPNLECIQVDDSLWSANSFNWIKDDQAHYSEDCGYTGVEEFLTEGTEISIFPNPFSNSATINYTMENPGKVRINVYDNLGQEITTLVDEFQDAGTHSCVFNSDNLSPGVYFYKIQIDNAARSGKLLLIK